MTTNKEMKDQICKKFNDVSFRKFGNAFRKTIDTTFKAEYNLKSVGGQVDKSFSWFELASYIIGDGSYSVTEEQFYNFMNEFKNG